MGTTDAARVVRIVLAEDHVAFRELLKLNFDQDNRFQIVGETGSSREVEKLCRELHPDLLILDFFLPGGTGFELIRKLTTEFPQVRILVLTGCEEQEIIDEIIKTPIAGYVAKTASLKVINMAVETILADGQFRGSPPYADDSASRSTGDVHLTTREREILKMIATGLSTKEISNQLGLSVKTVDHHRTHMMRKLNIHDVVSLTRYALRHGIATLG